MGHSELSYVRQGSCSWRGPDNTHSLGGPPTSQEKRGLRDTVSEAVRDFLALVWGGLGQGSREWIMPVHRLEGSREGDQSPACPRALTCLPPGPSGHSFLWGKNPLPSPTRAVALLLRFQTLHAISRLSAFALAVPSAKCLPHCPCLSTTSSFFKAQLRCPTSSL